MARDQDSQGSEATNDAEERAIREKLRASGWDKNKRKKYDDFEGDHSRQEGEKDRAGNGELNDKKKKERKKSERNEKDHLKSEKRKKSRQQSAQRGTLVEIVGAKLASFEKKAVEAADLVQELTIETKHAEKEVGVEIGTDGRIGADALEESDASKNDQNREAPVTKDEKSAVCIPKSNDAENKSGVQKKLDTADCFLNHLLSPEPDPNLVIILGRFRGHDVVDVLVGESPIPFHHVFVIGIIAQDQDRSLNDAPEADRDANSSPEPHEHPPVSGDGTPSITQLMQQYPTLSLQDIISKMQASNVTMAAAVAMKPARELYVGNLPATITGPQLQEFLGTIIQQVGLSTQPGNPILSVWISTDGHFAFCEMRSVEECNLALLLNQLPLLGQPLKFGRPRSFMGPPQPMPIVSARTQTALVNLGCTPNPVWFASPDVASLGMDSMTAATFGNGLNGYLSSSTSSLMSATALAESLASLPSDTNATQLLMSNIPSVLAEEQVKELSLASLPSDLNAAQLLMSNIPSVLAEEQVKELVQPFGELNFFKLIKDPMTGQSTGSAIFEYQENQVTIDALNGLDGLDIGGVKLSVRHALNGLDGLDIGGVKLSVRRAPDATKYPQIAVLLPGAAGEDPGPVLKMANMVSEDELQNDEEFADLKEDVEEECKRFGTILALDIPRPQALCGRKFGGNVVKVTYFSLSKFEAKDYS
ncbi:hypothetical protein ABG067_001215 [Albugo candida]